MILGREAKRVPRRTAFLELCAPTEICKLGLAALRRHEKTVFVDMSLCERVGCMMLLEHHAGFERGSEGGEERNIPMDACIKSAYWLISRRNTLQNMAAELLGAEE